MNAEVRFAGKGDFRQFEGTAYWRLRVDPRRPFRTTRVDRGATGRAESDPEKVIVYNELVANAVALQNVVDQSQAFHALRAAGVPFKIQHLAYRSPNPTSKLKRFGAYPTQWEPEPIPASKGHPYEACGPLWQVFARIFPWGHVVMGTTA